MPIATNFTSVFIKNWEINFMQCMPNGFLKYTELCNLLQLTAATHSELGGISFVEMQQYNQAWVLSRMRVEVTQLPKSKEIITIKTWIISLENSRSTRAFEVFIGDKKIIGSETFWAVFNTKTRRPESLALPHQHFEKYPNHRATEISISKINFDFDFEKLINKTVVLSDLDIVNHVNNIKYLEWCIDTLDVNLILHQKINSFEMNFLKELSINDEVNIDSKTSDDGDVFLITKNEKRCFILQLNR